MTSENDRPEAGSGQPDPAEGTPRFTDKRRIDPETGEVRQPTPEEQVLADAESIAQGAEEEVVLEGLIESQ